MKKLLYLILFPFVLLAQNYPNANIILQKVDDNMNSKNRILESSMVIHGRRSDRTVSSKGYTEDSEKSFTEYLSPERDKGTKMLKLDDRLWIYSPTTDRTIQLSGHMLRQSVMGSDLSYEDMMENRKLKDLYNAKVVAEETLDGRKTWLLELTAKVEDVAYEKRKIWIDQERFVPLKEELYAKSGKMLKKTVMSDVVRMGNRWYPKKINYKDVLKDGEGTDFIVSTIQFDVPIPDYIFSKASLKK
ncbi:MAG: outer membrane lipoprotein-sorting protein [Spirosomataceae bacterium]